MAYERVCPAAKIARGTVVTHDINGVSVAIAHCDDGTFHAVADTCSHEEFPLSDGTVAGCTIECAWHGSEFDLRTGEALNLPAVEPVPVYPVEVRDGDVYVSLVPSNSNSSDGAVK
jgi:3-phenylpropionate/trans-cinnamate dioxygenase ferredoxin subunit